MIELVVHEGAPILRFEGTVHVLLIVLDLERRRLLFIDIYDIGPADIIKEYLASSLGLDSSSILS